MGKWACRICGRKDASNHVAKNSADEDSEMRAVARAHVYEFHPELRKNIRNPEQVGAGNPITRPDVRRC